MLSRSREAAPQMAVVGGWHPWRRAASELKSQTSFTCNDISGAHDSEYAVCARTIETNSQPKTNLTLIIGRADNSANPRRLATEPLWLRCRFDTLVPGLLKCGAFVTLLRLRAELEAESLRPRELAEQPCIEVHEAGASHAVDSGVAESRRADMSDG
jgi:hypothetical protein